MLTAQLCCTLNKGLLWSRVVAACVERLWQVPASAWHPKIHTSLCLEALSRHQQLYVPSLRSVRPAGIGSEVWTPVVIGEFPEEDARAFLEVLLKERTALLNDSTWSKVYNVSHLCMPGVVVCAWIGGPHVRTIALFVVPPHVCSKTMCGVLAREAALPGCVRLRPWSTRHVLSQQSVHCARFTHHAVQVCGGNAQALEQLAGRVLSTFEGNEADWATGECCVSPDVSAATI